MAREKLFQLSGYQTHDEMNRMIQLRRTQERLNSLFGAEKLIIPGAMVIAVVLMAIGLPVLGAGVFITSSIGNGLILYMALCRDVLDRFEAKQIASRAKKRKQEEHINRISK